MQALDAGFEALYIHGDAADSGVEVFGFNPRRQDAQFFLQVFADVLFKCAAAVLQVAAYLPRRIAQPVCNKVAAQF